MNEEEVLVGRIQDLAEQCYHRDVPSHTEFLTLAEQDLFYRTVNKIPGVRYVLSGGYEAAERKAALFLPSYAEDGDASMLPIAVVRISPLNEKFADALSHRDFLGSLMNLGVERYKLGDILIDGNQAYLICMADMADYICAELKKVRHTSVYCEVEAEKKMELVYVVSDSLVNGEDRVRKEESTSMDSPDNEDITVQEKTQEELEEEQVLNQVIGEFLQ